MKMSPCAPIGSHCSSASAPPPGRSRIFPVLRDRLASRPPQFRQDKALSSQQDYLAAAGIDVHLDQRLAVQDRSPDRTGDGAGPTQHALQPCPALGTAEPPVGLVLAIAQPELVKIRAVLPHHLRCCIERITVAGEMIMMG